ncbi:metabotropic gaba-b receptor subtype 2 isoform c [Anaeramoeba flamelloides]|uniref:Metabotropic gaba-b receptor subtype 2 isoform c n=1 Tax=Anaeramoeba flamelloides TaxID=1746091 RepID=A0AAV7YZX4_9EUKA|nr:metabotropic gaba-b receptor subtype 2 isoform c [Anaeramoeba flamelloides]
MLPFLLETSAENERGLWADYLVTVLVLVICCFTLIGVSIFYYYRKYPGIKAKQPEIVLISTLSGILISISCIMANNHFYKEKGTFWAFCNFWKAWVQLILGASVWVNCLILRSYRLYRVFIQRKKTTVRFFWAGLGVLQTPWLIVGIITSAINGVEYQIDGGKCSFKTPLMVTFTILFVINICLLLITVWQTRKIVEEYSGFKELRLGLIGSLVAVIISGLLWGIKEIVNKATDSKLGSIIWREFYTSTLVIIVAYLFWKQSLYVMKKAFQNDQEYVDKLRKAITKFNNDEADKKIAKSKKENEKKEKKKKKKKKEKEKEKGDVEMQDNPIHDKSQSSSSD